VLDLFPKKVIPIYYFDCFQTGRECFGSSQQLCYDSGSSTWWEGIVFSTVVTTVSISQNRLSVTSCTLLQKW